ncbi:hypothetical protein REPUB_Repub05bG0094900 [Reevesia pubescens]
MFKAVLIDGFVVRESNLLSRFATNEFCLGSKPIIGVEFTYCNVKIGDKSSWLNYGTPPAKNKDGFYI